MENIQNAWRHNVITPAVEHVLRDLKGASVIAGFYLAGGTALALQLGHRRSHDLDFFSQELFDEEAFVQNLRRFSDVSLAAKSPHTLHAVVQGVKVSFLGYAYPLLFSLKTFLGVQVADPRDIACMKLSAIASRGARRDFVDLYAVAKEFGLGELLDLFHQKYAQTRYNSIHLLKSLVYFTDAEKDPPPDMLAPFSWDEIKQFFVQQVPRLRQSP
jgi:hypothetical protein